jgi:hypothetical protein
LIRDAVGSGAFVFHAEMVVREANDAVNGAITTARARAGVISMSRNSPGELPLLGGDLRDLKVMILRLRAQRKGQSRTHRSMRLFLSRDSRTKGLSSHHFIFDLALTNRFTRTRAPYSRSNSSVLSIRVMSGVNIKFEVFLVGPKIQHNQTGPPCGAVVVSSNTYKTSPFATADPTCGA